MDTDNSFTLEDILNEYVYFASQMKSRVDKRLMKEFLGVLITKLGFHDDAPYSRYIGLKTKDEQDQLDAIVKVMMRINEVEGLDEFLESKGIVDGYDFE